MWITYTTIILQFASFLLQPRAFIPKEIPGYLSHLDLFTSFSYAVSPEMSPDVFKRLMPAVAIAAVHLDGVVGCLRGESVRVIIAHANLVAHVLFNGYPRRYCFMVLVLLLDQVHLVGSS